MSTLVCEIAVLETTTRLLLPVVEEEDGCDGGGGGHSGYITSLPQYHNRDLLKDCHARGGGGHVPLVPPPMTPTC